MDGFVKYEVWLLSVPIFVYICLKCFYIEASTNSNFSVLYHCQHVSLHLIT